MSVFKTKGIILKIGKPKDKDFIYTIFTYDFGKVLVSKKKNSKEKLIDLGYCINCEIRTKEGINIHKASNIKIISEFDYENKNFEVIQGYLKLLNIVLKNTPDGNPVFEIFEILSSVNTYKDITPEKLCLTRLKAIDCLGHLDIEHKNTTIKKILSYINTHSINDILRLTGIKSDIYQQLQKLENDFIS